MPKEDFNTWIRNVAKLKGFNVSGMLNDKTYDYELFYNKEPDMARAMLYDSPDAHFNDIGKTAYHPTFSTDSYYSGRKSLKNPKGIVGGKWTVDTTIGENGSRYTLSNSQLQNGWNIQDTIDYLTLNEPYGVTLKLPNGSMPFVNGAYFGGVLPQIVVTNKRK